MSVKKNVNAKPCSFASEMLNESRDKDISFFAVINMTFVFFPVSFTLNSFSIF